MIPEFDEDGLLPPGVHWATWAEVVQRFGGNERRELLLEGLGRALEALRVAGCRVVYIDGSFVTSKAKPGDFDGCWEPEGVDFRRIDPVLYDFELSRRAQKRKFGRELFPTPFMAGNERMIDFFQTDATSGRRKGIVAVRLRSQDGDD